MKILFLLFAFIPFILTVKAQRPSTSYVCELEHKHHQKAFYLHPGETREVKLGNWTLYAGLYKLDHNIKVSLRRIVTLMDASYRKEASKSYREDEKRFPVELIHDFAGKTDTFNMTCFSR